MMNIQRDKNLRFAALDFETTGLDNKKDEPIQVGIVITNYRFEVIETYSSLIKPKKNIKELKSIVSHITGLQLTDLDQAPSIEEILPTIKRLLTPNTILIGQNISFDANFVKKYRPEYEASHMFDTYDRSQTLLHYQPSYALEVLWKRVASQHKASIEFIDTNKKTIPMQTEQYHDALYDSFVSLALFRFLVQKIENLNKDYPLIQKLIEKSPTLQIIRPTLTSGMTQKQRPLPTLGKPQSIEKKRDEPNEEQLNQRISLQGLSNKSSRFIGNLSLSNFLERTAHNTPIIYAVHTRQKLDIIKHHLQDLGHSKLGYAKDEQHRNHQILERIVNQETLAEFEVDFFLKYISHHHQGLSVIDIKNKDHWIYQLAKQESTTKQHDIMITTHAGLYHLIKDQRYKDYTIAYLDADRRHYSFNYYQGEKINFDYFNTLIETWYYVFRRRVTLSMDEKAKNKYKAIVALLYSFKQSFTVFTGTIGIEMTKKFTGIPYDSIECNPIIDNPDFYKTTQLWPRLEIIAEQCWKERGTESLALRHHREKIQITLQSLVKVNKKMQDNTYLHYSYSLVHNYIEFTEFLDQFENKKTLFLSHFKETNKYLTNIKSTESAESMLSSQDIAKQKKLFEHIKESEYKQVAILSTIKTSSQDLFQKLSNNRDYEDYTIIAENITGGTGKNLFRLSQVKKYIIIGGYYFLLAVFAKKISLDILIIHQASGPRKKLIIADCLYYK